MLSLHAKDACKFGLWVNLAKNPRVKSIEFTELAISTELPKSLALASVAIRAMHFTYDRLTPLDNEEAAGTETPGPTYMSLGGVLCLDLLTLPPPTKKVKGWVIRQINDMTTNVHRQPYPIPPAASDAAAAPLSGSAPPLRICYAVPKNVIVPPSDRLVGWFDESEQVWKTDGLSELSFDEETRSVNFLSSRLTSLAMLQFTHIEFPYKNWLLVPLSHSSSSLTILTQRWTFEFEVSSKGCQLREPRLPELAELLDVPMAPPKLLLLLRQSGINLCPSNVDAKQLKLETKDLALEKELHSMLATLAPALQIAPSRWNQTRGSAKCTFRIAPKKNDLDLEAEMLGDAPPPKKEVFADVDPSWQTMMVARRFVACIKALDSDAVCDVGVMQNMEAHSTAFLAIKDQYPEVAQEVALSSAL